MQWWASGREMARYIPLVRDSLTMAASKSDIYESYHTAIEAGLYRHHTYFSWPRSFDLRI